MCIRDSNLAFRWKHQGRTDFRHDYVALVKSLANSREYISENELSRANTKLSEIEIELQSLAGRVAYIKSSI